MRRHGGRISGKPWARRGGRSTLRHLGKFGDRRCTSLESRHCHRRSGKGRGRRDRHRLTRLDPRRKRARRQGLERRIGRSRQLRPGQAPGRPDRPRHGRGGLAGSGRFRSRQRFWRGHRLGRGLHLGRRLGLSDRLDDAHLHNLGRDHRIDPKVRTIGDEQRVNGERYDQRRPEGHVPRWLGQAPRRTCPPHRR